MVIVTRYSPDRWVLVKISSEGTFLHYRVLGIWQGGYTQGDSWRLNSGIDLKSTADLGEAYEFTGASGSIYACRKTAEGATPYMLFVLHLMMKSSPGLELELVPVEEILP